PSSLSVCTDPPSSGSSTLSLHDALPISRTHVAFAIKANPNLAVLKVLAREGFGADVVSGGEISRALAAGMPAGDIVFSGVGKTRDRKSTRLNSSHVKISYAVFCLKKKKK